MIFHLHLRRQCDLKDSQRIGRDDRVNDVFDFGNFDSLSDDQKKVYIWSRVHEIVAAAAKKLGNAKLEQANEYAYTTGMQRSLIADYKILETDVILFDQAVAAAIWYNRGRIRTLKKDVTL